MHSSNWDRDLHMIGKGWLIFLSVRWLHCFSSYTFSVTPYVLYVCSGFFLLPTKTARIYISLCHQINIVFHWYRFPILNSLQYSSSTALQFSKLCCPAVLFYQVLLLFLFYVNDNFSLTKASSTSVVECCWCFPIIDLFFRSLVSGIFLFSRV